LREVLIVGAVAVVAVLGAQVLSALVPAVGDVFRQTPVIVIGLVVATAFVLWRIAAGPPPEPPHTPES
jgi:ABC-type amino acid transport system permease subunit